MKTKFKNSFLLFLLLCFGAALAASETHKPTNRLMCFAGHRNRSHFKLENDVKLSKYLALNFVWDVRIFNDRTEFLKMTSTLRRLNPNCILGSYASACTTMPEKEDTYPPAKLPLEQCDSKWLLRDKQNGKPVPYSDEYNNRSFLDMRIAEVREAIIKLAIARAKYNGLDAICFDNSYWGLTPGENFPVPAEDWTAAFIKFFKETGELSHAAGLKCYVNVATYPSQIPNAFQTIAPYVDGIMTEMAFHPQARTPEGLLKELKAYENVLKQGKTVLLIPRYKEDEQFALLAIRPLAKKYGNIYLTAAGPIHDEPLYNLAAIDWDIAVDD